MKYSGVKHQPFFKINSHVHNIATVTLNLTENTSFHKINVREYRRGNQKRKFQRNWQQINFKKKTKKPTTLYVLNTLFANKHK
jgi:hypothetical protein